MNNVILQPARDKAAQENYKKTVLNSISIGSIAEFITAEQQSTLREIYPSGEFKIWGVDKDNAGNRKVNDWNRITRGDIALFAKDKFVYSSATVTYKLHNAKLAAFLWGYKQKGITWEYLYFLDELIPQHISYASLNSVIPKGKLSKNEFYAPNKNIQGFQVLSDVQSESVFAAFEDLQSENYLGDVTEGNPNTTKSLPEYNLSAVLKRLSEREDTDHYRYGKTRKEQRDLNLAVFQNNSTGICGICHQEYPVALLVTAHIKKRSECGHEERIDPNIVMPMCRMGCDGLYENGHISVKDGKVITNQKNITTAAVEKMKEAVAGNDCAYYNDKTTEYFKWHSRLHGGNPQ